MANFLKLTEKAEEMDVSLKSTSNELLKKTYVLLTLLLALQAALALLCLLVPQPKAL